LRPGVAARIYQRPALALLLPGSDSPAAVFAGGPLREPPS
jgi:hypothetical protein